MLGINAAFLDRVAELHRSSGDATVTIEDAPKRRAIHVAHGHLVAVDSNLKSERLGDLLASEGRLDAALIALHYTRRASRAIPL